MLFNDFDKTKQLNKFKLNVFLKQGEINIFKFLIFKKRLY